MIRRLRPLPGFVLLASALQIPIPPVLSAGVVIRVETRDQRSSSRPIVVSQIWIEGHQLRIDNQQGGSEVETAMVFDGENDILVAINYSAESFVVMDSVVMSEVAERMRDSMDSRQAELDELSEADREKMRQLLESQGRLRGAQGSAADSHQVRKADVVATMDDHPCRRFDVFHHGEKIQEIWVTDWDNVGLDAESLAVFRSFGRFFESIMESLPRSFVLDNPFTTIHRADGFPVRLRSFEKGSMVDEMRLSVEEKKPLAPDLFRPPEGYTQGMP